MLQPPKERNQRDHLPNPHIQATNLLLLASAGQPIQGYG